MKVPTAKKNPALVNLMAAAHLKDTYDKFAALCEVPDNCVALIHVAIRLKDLFELESWWTSVEPFCRWDEVADLILKNRRLLVDQLGPHLQSGLQDTGSDEQPPKHPAYYYIKKHPLYAMMCNDQEVPDLAAHYGSLRLQVLHARWLEASENAKLNNSDVVNILLQARDSKTRTIRHSYDIALTLRNMSKEVSSSLVEDLLPCRDPKQFVTELASVKRPAGPGLPTQFKKILNHCARRTRTRDMDRGERTRGTSQRTPPDYVAYGEHYLGYLLNPGNEADQMEQETIQPVSGTAAEALALGLHPLELTTGNLTIRAKVRNGETGTKDASEAAKAAARCMEIERRLFLWTSDKTLLEHFHLKILPALAHAASHSVEETVLAVATLIGISIETGRQIKEVVPLWAEVEPDSDYTFVPPQPPSKCGTWFWRPVEPEYASKIYSPVQGSIQRPNYLHYRASRLVTDLIMKHWHPKKIKAARLFDDELDYEASARKWLKQLDPYGTCTPAKLADLRWGILHRLTGGELANTCLILGLRHKSATVELHYAALGTDEAARLFGESAKELWGEYDPEAGNERTMSGEEGKLVGIRGFPDLENVIRVVNWMREGSIEFFRGNITAFDPVIHAELLNRAVLYLVWHQFFAFATRAIRDAYQPFALFSTDGLAVLSDKDFEDHHKARLIWADKRLLAHMRRMEERLGKIRERIPDCTFPADSPVWFLTSKNEQIEAWPIQPKTIDEHLKKQFPFAVNTPRKIMRNQLRLAKLTHEEAETYMGHWWDAREPWSPVSSFCWRDYLDRLRAVLPDILRDLGFTWVPGETNDRA